MSAQPRGADFLYLFKAAPSGRRAALSSRSRKRRAGRAACRPVPARRAARSSGRSPRQLRNDGLPVPPTLDELAAFLTIYVRTRHAATGVAGGYGTPQAVTVMPRLLITTRSGRLRM